jgi:hypothetical protein
MDAEKFYDDRECPVFKNLKIAMKHINNNVLGVIVGYALHFFSGYPRVLTFFRKSFFLHKKIN